MKTMEMKQLYVPEEDLYYTKPYIDVEEWRDAPVRHYYVHGGFQGTEKGGFEVRFCFYYPERKNYEGRFFQYLSPAPEDEHESEKLAGEDDKISFCLMHGAYYVVSNQGGFQLDDPQRLFRSNANVAQFSRLVAQRIYEYGHRPYGYCFGGSGGSFKTMGCMEMTEGIWDGAVPYVLANPMAAPNVFAPRVRAMRILGEEGMKQVVDAMEPGGNGDIYAGLTEEQKQALDEVSRMGFPKRGWFSWPTMGDGALMVLAPYIYNVYPQYFTDFWEKPGFAGADPDSSETRSRVRFITTVAGLAMDREDIPQEFTSVDNSWQNMIDDKNSTPKICMAEQPPEDANLFHCRLRVLSGAAAGKEAAVDTIRDGIVTVSNPFGTGIKGNVLEGLQCGDEIMIDNSDYLAMQTLQRHQVPDGSYHVYDQYRDGTGKPIYPQLPFLLAPIIAQNGAGVVPCGDIHGKVIALCSILDESAYAWHGDWYRNAVRTACTVPEEDCFRLYYNDNCIHDDRAGHLDDPQHQVDYLGILHQALLDVAAWCEKGIKPVPTTSYRVEEGQVIIPETAAERGGLQPVVNAYANGQKSVTVKAGEAVTFTAKIEAPPMTGTVTAAAWDYEGKNDFSSREELGREEDGSVTVRSTHRFEKPGTYFPVIKVQSNRMGTLDDIFTQCKNLDRVRVVITM